MKESNAGKQCVKVPFNRACTPDVCGILSCEHSEPYDWYDLHMKAIKKQTKRTEG